MPNCLESEKNLETKDNMKTEKQIKDFFETYSILLSKKEAHNLAILNGFESYIEEWDNSKECKLTQLLWEAQQLRNDIAVNRKEGLVYNFIQRLHALENINRQIGKLQ